MFLVNATDIQHFGFLGEGIEPKRIPGLIILSNMVAPFFMLVFGSLVIVKIVDFTTLSGHGNKCRVSREVLKILFLKCLFILHR